MSDMSVMSEILTRREDGGVVHLRMNRPERLNALDAELVDSLNTELTNIDSSCTAVVLSGAGRAFCAGHDLREEAANSATPSDEELHSAAEKMQDITRSLRGCPAPVIAQVQGYALGGGCEIALCCDLIVATHDAQFGFPETGISMVVTNGVSATLSRAVGPHVAKELIFVGDYISAQRAFELGLVNRVVPHEQLDATVADLIDKLKARGRSALQASKRLIDDGMAADIEDALGRESAALVRAQKSAEGLAAVREFVEKRLSDRVAGHE